MSNYRTTVRELGTVQALSTLDLLKADAKGWYDTTANTLKTDAVASFTRANSETLTIAHAASGDFQFSGNFTVGGWFKPTSTANGQMAMGKWDGSTGSHWYIYINPGGAIVWGMYVTGTIVSHPVGTAVAGTLYHLMMVRDGAVMRPYINGVAQTTVTCPTGTLGATTSFLSIGSTNNSGGNWTGQIYGVGAWGAAKSAATITALYNSGAQRPYSILSSDEKANLISFWPMNEPSGTRYDAHGSNDLTDNNTVDVATGPVQYIAGEHAAITKWENQAGNASPFADLTRGAATLSPILSSGIPDWYNAAHALKSATGSMTQIHTIIALVNLNSAGVADTLVDGYGATNRGLIDNSAGGLSYLFSTTALFGPAVASGRRLYIGELNGASSSLKITGYSDTTGDAGTGNMSGASVGSANSTANPFNGTIEYVILIDRALTAAEITALNTL